MDGRATKVESEYIHKELENNAIAVKQVKQQQRYTRLRGRLEVKDILLLYRTTRQAFLVSFPKVR